LRARDATDALAARLREDPDPSVRAAAAVAPSKIGGAGAADHLLAALDDPAPPVRWQVAFNLGRLGDGRAVGR
jgi:HEAT repeat protein